MFVCIYVKFGTFALHCLVLAPATGQDVMDVMVLLLQLPGVSRGVPRGLDTTEQIVRRLETIVEDETFRAALSKSHEEGVHQKVCGHHYLSEVENDLS